MTIAYGKDEQLNIMAWGNNNISKLIKNELIKWRGWYAASIISGGRWAGSRKLEESQYQLSGAAGKKND